ncbi:MAG: alanine racemase [candidate division Zixibacteria bacterium RBG_16_48_11]|nr:MAG: alanine racemase [candidate division Zixibacteria bacterium RBG_16_48_11]
MLPKTFRPAWLEVSRSALAYNCRNIQKKLGKKVELLAMVKANAYGQGAVECSRIFLKNGAKPLGVAIIEEGIELRKAGIQAPILVVYPEMAGREELVVKYNLEQTVCDFEFAKKLSSTTRRKKKKVNLYVKVDTGMGRYGLTPQQAVDLAEKLAGLPNIEVKGIMSHFSSAFRRDKTHTFQELNRFQEALNLLEEKGIDIPVKSIANSSATLDLPESYFNQARVGILLYGIYPSAENTRSVSVKAAASLKAKISFIKRVPQGTPISYMRTFHTTRESIIATVPLGYCDGYNFLLSNRGVGIVKGQEVPVVGRVCMDSLMLDVTDIPNVRAGDEAVLFGKQKGKELTVDELASKAGLLSYELITRMGKRLPIVYTR